MEIPSISERAIHRIRLAMTLGWFLLICSLFYDPVSSSLTDPNNLQSPFHPVKDACLLFQGNCIEIERYTMGPRVFWSMVVPSSFFILLIFSHEIWRRICPLAFVSQLPRLLGLQRRNRIKNAIGQTVRYETFKVSKDSWLGKNFLYFQFFMLFLGLNIRLLFANSDRIALGSYLLFTLICVLVVGFLYGGKSWCQYFCPMAPVQLVFTGPRGFLGKQAHLQNTKITQSMCREIDKSGIEKSACVACQSPCVDIDAERLYWENIKQPDRQLLYYGYLGLAVGFYLYFYLYSGSWDFLSGGVWSETDQVKTLLGSGLYLFGHPILSIPKYIAVPLILGSFTVISYLIGLQIEQTIQKKSKNNSCSIDVDRVKNQIFSFYAFFSFNLIFFLGIYPTLSWIPVWLREFIAFISVFFSSAWFFRTYKRTAEQYKKERLANVLRKELKILALEFPAFLEGRNLDELKPDELYILARVLPKISHEKQLKIYGAILEEALTIGNIDILGNSEVLDTLRQNFNITEQDHQTVIDKLFAEETDLVSSYEKPDDKEIHELCELLISKNLLSPYQVKVALEEQEASRATFIEVLIEMKFISQEQLDKIFLEQNLRRKGFWTGYSG
ncbi:calcium-binding protein [Altericista sp. CCNU0014]|uniref:calcium-binding protein n=1 Tax=Altericista sp. CCNU0014 TaxID=3082949 RepID=UPI00384B5E88